MWIGRDGWIRMAWMLWDVGFSAVHLDSKSRERRGLVFMDVFGPVKCLGEEVNW